MAGGSVASMRVRAEIVSRRPTEHEWAERDLLARRLDAAPLDDEPLTDEDYEAMREAREDFAAGRTVSSEELRRELG